MNNQRTEQTNIVGTVTIKTIANPNSERFGEMHNNQTIERMATIAVDAEIARVEREIDRLKKLKGLVKDHELHFSATFVRRASAAGDGFVNELQLTVINPVDKEAQLLIGNTFPIIVG